MPREVERRVAAFPRLFCRTAIGATRFQHGLLLLTMDLPSCLPSRSGTSVMDRLPGTYLLTLAVFASFANAAPAAGPARKVDFSREVRPIFSGRCFQCHGPDDKA